MRTTILKLLWLGGALAATTALAVENSANGNGNYSALSGSLTPQSFVTQASLGDDKEVALGKLALQKSRNPQVRQFAERMIRDHSHGNSKLMAIAASKGLSCPPTNAIYVATTTESGVPKTEQLNPGNPSNPQLENTRGRPAEETQLAPLMNETNAALVTYRNLSSLNGQQFDRAYANDMVKDHQGDIQKYEEAAATLQDTQLKDYARKTLKTLHQHLQMAQKLQSEVGNAPVPGNPLSPNG